MCKKLLPIILCGASLALGGFAFNRQAQVGRPPAPPRNSVPEHVAYNFLFRATVFSRNKALAGGLPPGRNKALQEGAAISDAQYGVLEGVAASTLQEVEQLDARAQEVIKAFRARYPNGIVSRGEKLSEPPPELNDMQQQRNAIFLRGRDRLRAAFGEREFARFHEFTMRRFAGAGLGERGQQ